MSRPSQVLMCGHKPKPDKSCHAMQDPRLSKYGVATGPAAQHSQRSSIRETWPAHSAEACGRGVNSDPEPVAKDVASSDICNCCRILHSIGKPDWELV